jgi:hypothetical protein
MVGRLRNSMLGVERDGAALLSCTQAGSVAARVTADAAAWRWLLSARCRLLRGRAVLWGALIGTEPRPNRAAQPNKRPHPRVTCASGRLLKPEQPDPRPTEGEGPSSRSDCFTSCRARCTASLAWPRRLLGIPTKPQVGNSCP